MTSNTKGYGYFQVFPGSSLQEEMEGTGLLFKNTHSLTEHIKCYPSSPLMNQMTSVRGSSVNLSSASLLLCLYVCWLRFYNPQSETITALFLQLVLQCNECMNVCMILHTWHMLDIVLCKLLLIHIH